MLLLKKLQMVETTEMEWCRNVMLERASNRVLALVASYLFIWSYILDHTGLGKKEISYWQTTEKAIAKIKNV